MANERDPRVAVVHGCHSELTPCNNIYIPAQLQAHLQPEACFQKNNENLLNSNQSDFFYTLFLGVENSKKRRVLLAGLAVPKLVMFICNMHADRANNVHVLKCITYVYTYVDCKLCGMYQQPTCLSVIMLYIVHKESFVRKYLSQCIGSNSPSQNLSPKFKLTKLKRKV